MTDDYIKALKELRRVSCETSALEWFKKHANCERSAVCKALKEAIDANDKRYKGGLLQDSLGGVINKGDFMGLSIKK